LTILTFVILLITFTITPLPGGDDSESFINAARRALEGKPLYGVLDPHYYSNPPWFALALLTVAWLPLRISFGLIMVISIMIALRLLQRWHADHAEPIWLKSALVLLSPPMLYLLLHGQVDLLILGFVLLPTQFWGLGALTKPQVAIGLLLGIERTPKKIMQAVLMVGVAAGVSFILFGNWVGDMLDYMDEIERWGQNYWRHLFPFQVPLGVYFLLQGIRQRDERLLVAGSPFVSPYAATSSFIGPWLVALSYLSNWQAVALFASWWGVIIYQGVA
jgi:hypothetical protein